MPITCCRDKEMRVCLTLGISMLWSATSVFAQNYSGPRCLAGFCLDKEVPARQLLSRLESPRRSAPYCFKSADGASIYFDIVESALVVGDILLSDFGNCLHASVSTTSARLRQWETEHNIRLGSPVSEVV